MNKQSVIKILCSELHTPGTSQPYSPAAWRDLLISLKKLNISLTELAEISYDEMKNVGISEENAKKITRLFDDAEAVNRQEERYASEGIFIITTEDENYPAQLKQHKNLTLPPLFFYIGNESIFSQRFIGVVGSRSITDDDAKYTRSLTERCVRRGYSIVTGGALGTDITAEEAAFKCGGSVLEFSAEPILTRMKDERVTRALNNGTMLLACAKNPNIPFTAGYAMMRNRLIYACSCVTVAVRADYDSGGSWAGAIDNLKHRWCRGYVRANTNYRGNAGLLCLGALPASESWEPFDSYDIPYTDAQLSVFDE